MTGQPRKSEMNHVLTINDDICSCGVARSLAAEHDDRTHQLRRLTEAAHGDTRKPSGSELVDARSMIEDGVHIARANAVDPDAMNGPFGGQ